MKRIRSLDLARGFTVLFIPAIHTGMVFSQLYVHQTTLGIALIAIAEGPGGQLLMLLMGISFVLKGKQTSKSVIARTVLLLATGYLLNILKFVWPYEFRWLPPELLRELQIQNTDYAIIHLFSMGDILHFAALAQITIYNSPSKIFSMVEYNHRHINCCYQPLCLGY